MTSLKFSLLAYEKRYSERIRTDCVKDFILKIVLIEYAKEVTNY